MTGEYTCMCVCGQSVDRVSYGMAVGFMAAHITHDGLPVVFDSWWLEEKSRGVVEGAQHILEAARG